VAIGVVGRAEAAVRLRAGWWLVVVAAHARADLAL
jgi:hypothetical protein